MSQKGRERIKRSDDRISRSTPPIAPDSVWGMRDAIWPQDTARVDDGWTAGGLEAEGLCRWNIVAHMRHASLAYKPWMAERRNLLISCRPSKANNLDQGSREQCDVSFQISRGIVDFSNTPLAVHQAVQTPRRSR
jgi:hypothetical protein